MDRSKIILFDGVCNLCNSSVQFILERDVEKKFTFASLQGEFGQGLLQKEQLDSSNFDSFLFLEDNKLYSTSTAALKVAKHLKFPYHLLYLFIIVPRFIRDAVYNYIAKNRYKWFGKQESCWMPTPELRERFIP